MGLSFFTLDFISRLKKEQKIKKEQKRFTMVDSSYLSTLSALLFSFSGILFIVFWAMAIPLGSFVGAAAALHPNWNPSQIVHILAAITGLLGTAGIHGLHSSKTGLWGVIGSAFSIIGQACFFADGVIAYAVFPAIAVALPTALDIEGFMFTGPNYSAYTAFAVLFMIGYITLGVSLLYYKALPESKIPFLVESATVTLIVGSILSHLPPTAGFSVICAGGILWGIGAFIIGALWVQTKITNYSMNNNKEEVII